MSLGIFIVVAATMVYICSAQDKFGSRNCRERYGDDSPKCDSVGNYKLKQCNDDMCKCVKRRSGEPIRTYALVGERFATDPMTCECAYNQLFTRIDLQCIRGTGDYQALNCRNSKCRCISGSGSVLLDYDIFNEGESRCKCARAYDDYRKTGLIGKMFSCSDIGNYNTRQQIGSYHVCVDRDGNRLGEAIPMWQTLNCAL